MTKYRFKASVSFPPSPDHKDRSEKNRVIGCKIKTCDGTPTMGGGMKKATIFSTVIFILAGLAVVTGCGGESKQSVATSPKTRSTPSSGNTTWTNTGGAVSSYEIGSLAYDSAHNILYAGSGDSGVWKYDGTTWTNTGGSISSYNIVTLACDSAHSLLYAGLSKLATGYGVWNYKESKQ